MIITQHARHTAFYRLLRELKVVGFHSRIAAHDLKLAWARLIGLRMTDLEDTLEELRARGELTSVANASFPTLNLTDRGVIQMDHLLYPWRISWPHPIENFAAQINTQRVLAQVRRRHRQRAKNIKPDGTIFDRRSDRN